MGTAAPHWAHSAMMRRQPAASVATRGELTDFCRAAIVDKANLSDGWLGRENLVSRERETKSTSRKKIKYPEITDPASQSYQVRWRTYLSGGFCL